jgi:hypothetical protein
MRRLMFLVVVALALSVAAIEAAKPSSAGKPTTTKAPITTGKGSSAKGSSAKTKGPVTTTTKAAAGSSSKTVKADKHVAKADTKAAKPDAKSAKAERKTGKHTTESVSSTATNGTTSTPGTKTTASTTGIDYTATSLSQKLQKNSVQRSKIEAKLKAAGYTGTIYEAAYGFKNLGQLNAATNMVQNQGTSFELLKVLMTGKYVDPETHVLYRAQRMPDGTVKLVSPDLATNPVSTLSLGQSKQAIAGGAVMPEIVPVETTTSQTRRSF